MQKPIYWEKLFEAFLAKFIPDTTKTKKEHKFINLRQAGKTVDEYAVEFSKIYRFTTYMISTEENHAKRLQGLNLDISFRYKTFAEVLMNTRE